MNGKRIKLHNRRVTIYEFDENDEDVLLEFKSFDNEVYPRNKLYLGEYGCVVETDRKQRAVSIKISRDALQAIVDLAPEFLNNNEEI